MSRAFVKEEDDQWLHDLPPTMKSLIQFLTKENNSIRVHEKRNYLNEDGKEVHEMSNGLSYAINKEGKWYIVEN